MNSNIVWGYIFIVLGLILIFLGVTAGGFSLLIIGKLELMTDELKNFKYKISTQADSGANNTGKRS